jgi:hypothetical protein
VQDVYKDKDVLDCQNKNNLGVLVWYNVFNVDIDVGDEVVKVRGRGLSEKW